MNKLVKSIKDCFRSFRDPMGSVAIIENRVFRLISPSHESAVLEFLENPFFLNQIANGNFPITKIALDLPEALNHIIHNDKLTSSLILQHELIPFPIYPHEWTPSMLFDAGQFTIDLAEQALTHGLTLKDATPWNVLFSDGRPMFCDMLSFEAWMGSKIWLAYSQFQRTFVLPLYANKQHAWPVHSTFIDKRDGLDPSILVATIKGWRRWAPFELQTIIFPTKLSRGSIVGNKITIEKVISHQNVNYKLAEFVMRRSFKRLRGQLFDVLPNEKQRTKWSHYEDDLLHYSVEEHDQKLNFVRESLLRSGKGRVLDIGANAGEYSIIAATQGNSVVATDFDIAALDKLYIRVKAERLPITPVVFNIARPTPAVGWNNQEVDSFLTRAKGQFNVLMVLAILHHLIVTERVPLNAIVKLLYELEAKFLIIEWVSPNDLRFKQISKTHDNLYANLTEDSFRIELEHNYSILERLQLRGGTRALYLCERH